MGGVEELEDLLVASELGKYRFPRLLYTDKSTIDRSLIFPWLRLFYTVHCHILPVIKFILHKCIVDTP